MIRQFTTLSVVALGLAFGAPAAADTMPQGGGANNVVIVETTSDAAQRVRANTQIAPIGGPRVASSNVATATATGCTGCHSTAVAVQVLIVTSSPQYFAPGNAAAAVNSGCTSCGTFAYAWQYVVHVDGPAYLSPEGRLQAWAIAQEVQEVAGSVTPATLEDDLALQARLDALTSQLRDVIDNEVQHGNIPAVGTPEMHARIEYQPS